MFDAKPTGRQGNVMAAGPIPRVRKPHDLLLYTFCFFMCRKMRSASIRNFPNALNEHEENFVLVLRSILFRKTEPASPESAELTGFMNFSSAPSQHNLPSCHPLCLNSLLLTPVSITGLSHIPCWNQISFSASSKHNQSAANDMDMKSHSG